jgi:hypothetical protein
MYAPLAMRWSLLSWYRCGVEKAHSGCPGSDERLGSAVADLVEYVGERPAAKN